MAKHSVRWCAPSAARTSSWNRNRCRKKAPMAKERGDRKSTRLNSSHLGISYAVFCLKKKKKTKTHSEPNEKKTSYNDQRTLPIYTQKHIIHINDRRQTTKIREDNRSRLSTQRTDRRD